jgi:hypothetical protein
MKSGNLNFLEPSGPLQAGNGADCFTFTVALRQRKKCRLVKKRKARKRKKKNVNHTIK